MQDHTHVLNPSPKQSRTEINVDLFGSSYYLEEHDKGNKRPSHNGESEASSFDLIPSIEPVKIPGVLHSADALPCCHKGFVMGTCTNGHHFAKAILCGKEYCIDCGEKWSWIHQRRHYRWLPKVKSMQSVGYLVVTLPMEVRKYFMDQKRLSVFRRYCIRLLKREGFDRGLCRWHWCGEDGVTWHPHLNFLFPGIYIPKPKIRELRAFTIDRSVAVRHILRHASVGRAGCDDDEDMELVEILDGSQHRRVRTDAEIAELRRRHRLDGQAFPVPLVTHRCRHGPGLAVYLDL